MAWTDLHTVSDFNPNVKVALTDQWLNGWWQLAKLWSFIGDVPTDSGVFATDCILTKTDAATGDGFVYINEWSVDSPDFKLMGGAITLKYTLTSAQILSLNSSPVEVVPAPGAWKILDLVTFVWKLRYNSSPYDNRTIWIRSTWWSGNFNSLSGILDETGDYIRKWNDNGAEILENTGLEVFSFTADPVGWDSEVDLYITYNIIAL